MTLDLNMLKTNYIEDICRAFNVRCEYYECPMTLALCLSFQYRDYNDISKSLIVTRMLKQFSPEMLNIKVKYVY